MHFRLNFPVSGFVNRCEKNEALRSLYFPAMLLLTLICTFRESSIIPCHSLHDERGWSSLGVLLNGEYVYLLFVCISFVTLFDIPF